MKESTDINKYVHYDCEFMKLFVGTFDNCFVKKHRVPAGQLLACVFWELIRLPWKPNQNIISTLNLRVNFTCLPLNTYTFSQVYSKMYCKSRAGRQHQVSAQRSVIKKAKKTIFTGKS